MVKPILGVLGKFKMEIFKKGTNIRHNDYIVYIVLFIDIQYSKPGFQLIVKLNSIYEPNYRV